jgi:hypothetical protein
MYKFNIKITFFITRGGSYFNFFVTIPKIYYHIN